MSTRKRSIPNSKVGPEANSIEQSITEDNVGERSTCLSEFGALSRRKYIDLGGVEITSLNRCLNEVDLTFLGIGSTLGAGVYVLTGQVARETAGPAVNICFLIAAVASILAGLCYAEFGGRVPKTGSAYVYSYYAIGEIWAFVIGWNLILEYTIATASVARALSGYFDTLIDDKIQNFFREILPMDAIGLAKYPDFFAFGLCLLLTCLLALGVKESTRFNNVFTVINLLVVLYVIICGLFKADVKNWQIPKSQLPINDTIDNGNGGFAPKGMAGIFSGAATCFYAFVGFDIIATTGEEVKNPQKAIPFGIIASLIVIFIAYFSMSSILTLMCPYYLIDIRAPFPVAFELVGWGVAQYAITVGAICGLSTSLLGGMFPLPRILYAMASDGLIFKFLGKINERLKTPVLGTFISGTFAATLSLVFDLKELVDMLSIGTLLAYSLVAICVVLLRYRPAHPAERDNTIPAPLDVPDIYTNKSVLNVIIYPLKYANYRSLKAVQILTFLTTFSSIALSCLIIYIPEGLYRLFALIPGGFLILFFILLCRQPQDKSFRSFKMPLVPFFPVISAFINFYLMLELSYLTWIRFAVWQTVGFAIYFSYGMWHSSERHRKTPDMAVRNEHVYNANYESVDPSGTVTADV